MEPLTRDAISNDSSATDRLSLSDSFRQPLVSIIISNYNYAKYLDACVASAHSQIYKNIECILVDDASTDESGAIIGSLAQLYEDMIICRRDVNGGQSAALLDGLKRASGQFVIFLDADDILFSHAVASHVYVYNSLRHPVGFICSDMLQVEGEQLVLTSSPAFSAFISNHGESTRIPPRPMIDEIVRRPAAVSPQILNNAYLIDRTYKGWPWSATSGMMFRRDALRLWEDTPDLSTLRYSTDAFFCFGVNATCGCVLLDAPLSAYRFHGKNGFAARLPLNNLRTYMPNSQGERSVDALQLLLDYAQANKSKFVSSFLRGESDFVEMISYFQDCQGAVSGRQRRPIAKKPPFRFRIPFNSL